MPHNGMGSHQAATNDSDEWLTPEEIITALGPFDLDPASAPVPRPWGTARNYYLREEDGLAHAWRGRVWLNPPYGGPSIITPWMRRMADHDHVPR